jgi:hypothetical protein
MVADSRQNPNPNSDDPGMSGLVRSNPVLSLASTNPISTNVKQQQEVAIGLTATQVDGPWLVMLDEENVGKLCKIAYWNSTHIRNAYILESHHGTSPCLH